MEQRITNRTEKFVNYMNIYTKLYLDKYVYKTTKSIFTKCKKISSGIEGIVYKAILGKANHSESRDPVIVKQIDLKKLTTKTTSHTLTYTHIICTCTHTHTHNLHKLS